VVEVLALLLWLTVQTVEPPLSIQLATVVVAEVRAVVVTLLLVVLVVVVSVGAVRRLALLGRVTLVTILVVAEVKVRLLLDATVVPVRRFTVFIMLVVVPLVVTRPPVILAAMVAAATLMLLVRPIKVAVGVAAMANLGITAQGVLAVRA
jgi:hypothetical protein